MHCILGTRSGIFKNTSVFLEKKTNANTVKRKENFARYNSNEALVQEARGGEGVFLFATTV